MACDRFKDRVGYRGQKYEVLADKENGTVTRLGWQNGPDLRAWEPLAKAWRLTNLRTKEVEPEWNPMSTAPKTAREITVLMKDGTTHARAHWAEDLSGSDQPPYRGWFVSAGSYFRGIEEPVGWKEPE